MHLSSETPFQPTAVLTLPLREPEGLLQLV